MKNISKLIIKNSTILISGSIVSSLLSILVIILITKNIELEKYGIVVMVQSYIIFVDQLFNFQSWQALIKYGGVSLEKKKIDEFKLYIRLSLILDILGSILAFTVSFFMLKPISIILNFNINLINPFLFYSIVILFKWIGTPTALLRLSGNYKYFNYQLFINWGIKLFLISIFVVIDKLSVKNIIIIFTISEILSYIYLISIGKMILNKFDISLGDIFLTKQNLLFSRLSYRFLQFAFRTNFNSAILGSIRTIDELIVGSLLSPAAAGIFKIMKLIGTLISKFLDPLYMSSYPEFSRLVDKNRIRDIFSLIKKFTIWNTIISIVILILFNFTGEYIIKILFSENYIANFLIIELYLGGVLISFVMFYTQPLMLSFEYEKEALYINIVASFIYISLLYFYIKLYGLWAIAISLIIFSIIVNFSKIIFIFMKKFYCKEC